MRTTLLNQFSSPIWRNLRKSKMCDELAFARVGIFALAVLVFPLNGQGPLQSAMEAFQRGLHFGDLYNWADAAKDFTDAERMFVAAGDQRNALYARLGKIRATIEQRSLPIASADLESELESNPLLQNDKQLRMFCLIVKGDVDAELNSAAMRKDWEQVQALAQELGDKKWQYRSLAQLGLAAFYDGDLPTATKNVGAALMAATANSDAGARIRFMSAIGLGFMQSKMNEQALNYYDNALKIANVTPDAGYQFLAIEGKIEALAALGRLDAAQQLADESMRRARQDSRPGHEAVALALSAELALARHDNSAALPALEQSVSVAEKAGLPRQLAAAQAMMSEVYRAAGDLQQAERFAELAVASTQESGNAWQVPQCLQILAELEIMRGKYAEADRVFDQADAFIDGMIGNYSGVFEKTALIRAASDLYARHFSLVAGRFKDPGRAYAIVEQVRGRVMTDLLLSGSVTSEQAKKNERALSQLRLKLMTAIPTTRCGSSATRSSVRSRRVG